MILTFVFGDSENIVNLSDNSPLYIDEETYRDIKFFVKEELNCAKHKQLLKEKYPGMSMKKAITKESEELAKNIAQTSAQFSKGVKSITHDYDQMIRVSVHPHEDINEKCGIGLVYGSMGTPWHMSPILGLGEYGISLMKKREFIKKLCKGNEPPKHVCEINGVMLPYYQWVES